MKVVHINTNDASGGAAIAALRLHEALLANGVDSKMLVGKTGSGRADCAELPQRRSILALASKHWGRWSGAGDATLMGTADAVLSHPFVREADVLHFHNLHHGYFNYRDVAAITREKPAAWTIHDMWPFTGHCVYSFECERWRQGCGQCPDLASYPAMRRDQTRYEWSEKKRVFGESRLSLVSLCHWMDGLLRESFLNRFPIHRVPNGLNVERYQPGDKRACRAALGIPSDAFILLFAAQSVRDPRKGGGLLLEALRSLDTVTRNRIHVLTLGDGGTSLADQIGLPMTHLGYVSSDSLKVLVFTAADVFVFPTRADNLPVVIQESLACGTPVVSVRVGGVPDMVTHLEHGWLAEANDAAGIAAGIARLAADRELHRAMSAAARAKAMSDYDGRVQAREIATVYRELLGAKS